MGQRLVVFKDDEPEIGVTFTWSDGKGEVALGWSGACTECGKPMHFWRAERAFSGGQAHVDSH